PLGFEVQNESIGRHELPPADMLRRVGSHRGQAQAEVEEVREPARSRQGAARDEDGLDANRATDQRLERGLLPPLDRVAVHEKACIQRRHRVQPCEPAEPVERCNTVPILAHARSSGRPPPCTLRVTYGISAASIRTTGGSSTAFAPLRYNHAEDV